MAVDPMRAPCGIDCSACAIHIAAQDPTEAEKLAQVWRESGMANAKAEWFKCQGCRGDRSLCWCDDCGLYACAVQEKGLEFCSQCDEFPCQRYMEWIGSDARHQAAFEWLKQQSDG